MSEDSTRSSIVSIYWLFAVIYAFAFWGFWWGMVNIFFPFAPIYDLVMKVGRL